MSLLRGVEKAKVNALLVYGDASPPAPPKFSDAKHSAVLVVGPGGSLILQIEALSNVPQIAKPIVSSRAIDVVNVLKRPAPICMKPRKSMSKVLGTVNANLDVPPAIDRASGSPFLGSTSKRNAPMKKSGAGVVVQQFAQTRSGKIRRSHEALQLLIGQRPAGVASTALASSFSQKGRAKACSP